MSEAEYLEIIEQLESALRFTGSQLDDLARQYYGRQHEGRWLIDCALQEAACVLGDDVQILMPKEKQNAAGCAAWAEGMDSKNGVAYG